jgi:hypothetical protein
MTAQRKLSRAAKNVCDRIFELLAYEFTDLRSERVVELYGPWSEWDSDMRNVDLRVVKTLDLALENSRRDMRLIADMETPELKRWASRYSEQVCDWPQSVRKALEIATHVGAIKNRANGGAGSDIATRLKSSPSALAVETRAARKNCEEGIKLYFAHLWDSDKPRFAPVDYEARNREAAERGLLPGQRITNQPSTRIASEILSRDSQFCGMCEWCEGTGQTYGSGGPPCLECNGSGRK